MVEAPIDECVSVYDGAEVGRASGDVVAGAVLDALDTAPRAGVDWYRAFTQIGGHFRLFPERAVVDR
jgi:hypothetical protein